MSSVIIDLLQQHLESADWRNVTDQFPLWRKRLSAAGPVSVVVPVFNGYEVVNDLVQGISSWAECCELIIVDDASTDPGVKRLLRETIARHGTAKLITNSRNLGFVRSVNVGLGQVNGDHDVIVLNSDANPTANWIQRLRLVATCQPKVATVSPLSNAAGFFSVKLPSAEPVNSELMSGLLGVVAPAMWEQATATSGFCWYITAQARAVIGLLDEQLFHRGYAEETDFCLRAQDQGMVNLCSLTSHVEHLGGESFGAEKLSLKRANASVLKALFPDFIETLRAFEESSLIPHLGQQAGDLLAKMAESDNYRLPTQVIFSDSPEGNDLGLSDSHSMTAMSFQGQTRVTEVPYEQAADLALYLAARICPASVDAHIHQPSSMDPTALSEIAAPTPSAANQSSTG